jgi:hypothetical protein
MGLTTTDHHLGLSTKNPPECEVLILENWTSEDVWGRAADLWGVKGREFKSYDMRFLNPWSYVIRATSRVMTARPPEMP